MKAQGKENKASAKGEKKSRKGMGGPRAKPASEKATCKVGGFWLKPAEKGEYERLYALSKLNNHTAFFRSIFFSGKLKLYYSDTNTLLIYDKLVIIQSQIEAIGDEYKEVAERVNSLGTDQQPSICLHELKLLTENLSGKLQEINGLFLACREQKEKQAQQINQNL